MIPVKGNQKKLREHLLESVRARKPQSSHSYQQKAHGRTINYRVKVWTVSALEGWAGLRGKKQVKSDSYYISREDASAYLFGKWIQGHRCIENNLHWVKDVILKEDSCQISKPSAALVMGILRSMALNLLRFAGVRSVSEGIMKMCAGVESLIGLISQSSLLSKVFA